jgi:hypothetical protein
VAPALGVVSRFACASCKRGARMLSGVRLVDVLSTPDGELEGSALNYLLDPVEVDGRRGWADFAGEAWRSSRSGSPPATTFDFLVQHCNAYAAVVAQLRSAPESRKDAQTIATLIRSAPAFWHRTVTRLAWVWMFAQQFGDAVAANGPVRSADDVRRLLNAPEIREPALQSGDATGLFVRLSALARCSNS